MANPDYTQSKNNFHSYWAQAMPYNDFSAMMKRLTENGQTTGEQTENNIYFTSLNQKRMARWDKTLRLLPAAQDMVKQIKQPLYFLAITESWCGDAAHCLPVFQKLATANDYIEVRLLLRDNYPELMDRYLTYSRRSIPIVIALIKNAGTFNEIFRWGPYPLPIAELKKQWKEGQLQITKDAYNIQLQSWYNADKSQTIQSEIAELLTKHLL